MGRKHLTPTARRLRANQTDAEERLWNRLRARQLEGEKFVRQFHATIEKYGYRVLRFWNHEVLANTDGVLEAIRQELLLTRDRTH